jgi:hypothetical protein
MNADGITIVFTCNPGDIDKLAVSLKTLEFNPPSVPYDVLIIPDGDGQRFKEFLSACSGPRLFEWPGSLGDGIVAALRSVPASFWMIAHPDVLFLSPLWCDAILSRMIESDISVMGSNMFEEIATSGGTFRFVPSWILVGRSEALRVIGSEDGGGRFRGPIIHFKTRAMGGAVAGAALGGLFHHMGNCTCDKAPPPDIERARLESVMLGRAGR